MKRLGVILSSTTAWVFLLGMQAWAQQYPPNQPPGSTDPYHGTNGDVAFTGASISLGVIILVGLVVVGALLLLAGRRRRAGAVQ